MIKLIILVECSKVQCNYEEKNIKQKEAAMLNLTLDKIKDDLIHMDWENDVKVETNSDDGEGT